MMHGKSLGLPLRACGAALICVAGLVLPAAAGANPWARLVEPGAGPPEVIGEPAAGCVRGAVSLPLEGLGYRVMRPSRNRFHGHPDLVSFVRRLGESLDQAGLGPMLVGDLGQPRGGPTPSLHRSHQNGLDVDIRFWLHPEARDRSLSPAEREEWEPPSMLAGGRLDPQRWGEAQDALIRFAALDPAVDRIFVHAAIKRHLCETGQVRDWLRKVRPWWGHDAHMHVRLRCPDGNTRCVGQAPLPAGDGCDGTLAWWFSEEASGGTRGRALIPRSPPRNPPPACEALLSDQVPG